FIPSTARCASASASCRRLRSRTACAGSPPSSIASAMPPAARHRLSERELHEYVAEVEGHDSQVTGVVGYFYPMYPAESRARLRGLPGRGIPQVGRGARVMVGGTGPG